MSPCFSDMGIGLTQSVPSSASTTGMMLTGGSSLTKMTFLSGPSFTPCSPSCPKAAGAAVNAISIASAIVKSSRVMCFGVRMVSPPPSYPE